MLDGPLVMGYESKIAGDQCVYGIYSDVILTVHRR